MAHNPLTTTNLLAGASEILGAHGYSRVGEQASEGAWGARGRLYEDPYGIVGIVVYETWTELSTHWLDAQAFLVEVISKHLSSSEAKAWEGYLVLLTPSILPADAVAEADMIRSDTGRLRKLLATGEELLGLGDVERVLMPLLPLHEVDSADQGSTLSMLPDVLSAKGLPRDAVEIVVKAFLDQQPLLERLHDRRRNSADR